MMAPEKVQLLKRFLGALPPEMASRLAKAIEIDRLSGGTALPHDMILDGLRPVLREASTARVPTPQRLFCQPFEDLLLSVPRKDKHKGMISREAIIPVWTWLEQILLPEATAAFVRDSRAALLSFREDAAAQILSEFWQAAGMAMRMALADKTARLKAKTILITDQLLADAEEMALLLTVGPEIAEAQGFLPRPVAALTDAVLLQLRNIHDRITERQLDAAPYVAVIAMRRLARPWEALRLPVFITRQAKDTLISSTDMGLVGEVLFAEMETHLAAIRAARHPDFDSAALVQAVAGFSVLSTGLVKEVEMRRDGKWGQRLVKDRAAAAESLEALIERAGKEILAALPTQRASYTGGSRSPDLSKAPDPGKRERARRYAELLTGCRHFAAAVSVAATLNAAEDEVRLGLRPYVEDVLKELRTTEGDMRARAEDYMGFATELTQLLVGAEDAEYLRRRAKAALAPPAEQSAA